VKLEDLPTSTVVFSQFHLLAVAFSALTLLPERQEEHQACEILSDDVLVWLSIWSEVQIVCNLHMVQLMPLHPETPSSFASFKPRLVLPFLCRLTLEKRPLISSTIFIVKKNIAIAGISRYWFCDSSYQIKALVIINLEWKSLGLCVTLQTPVCVFVLLQKTGRKRAAMV